MNLIKPHNNEFGLKYEITFDGNDYRITYAYARDLPRADSYGDRYVLGYHPKWVCLLRLACIRWFQWREWGKEKKVKARQLPVHLVLPY